MVVRCEESAGSVHAVAGFSLLGVGPACDRVVARRHCLDRI